MAVEEREADKPDILVRVTSDIEDALGSVADEQVVVTAVMNSKIGGIAVRALSLRDCDFDDYLAGRIDAEQASLTLRQLPDALDRYLKAVMGEAMTEMGNPTCQITWQARHRKEPSTRTPEVDDELVVLTLASMMDAYAEKMSGTMMESRYRH